MTKIVLLLIRVYQLFFGGRQGILAHIVGGGCSHFPTCSEYTYQIVKKQGVFKGLSLGVLRIARCSQF